MQGHALKCEECGKVAFYTLGGAADMDRGITAWFSIWVWAEQSQRDERLDFCSPLCLEGWARKKGEATNVRR